MAAAFRKPEHFWTLVWGGICVVLAAVIAAELVLGEVEAGKGSRAPAKAAEAKLLPAFVLASDAQAGGETTSRPLFVPGRRPAPPAASADAGTMKKGQFLLQGTTVVGDLSFAMLKEISSGKLHRVRKGEKLNELTVAEVGATHAVLTLGADSETVPLLVAKATGAPAAGSDRGPFAPPEAAAAPTGAQAPSTAQPQAPVARTPAPQGASPVPVPMSPAARAAARQQQGRQPAIPTAPPGPNAPVTFEDLARQRAEAAKR
jgi:hypothetical protein